MTMQTSLSVLTLSLSLGVLGGCAVEPSGPEEASVEEQAAAATGDRVILACTGAQNGATIKLEIVERKDAHTAVIDVAREGESTHWVEPVYGDVRRLGVNKLHVYFSNLTDDRVRLIEGFRKKLDTTSFAPRFVFTSEGIDTKLTCTRQASTGYLR